MEQCAQCGENIDGFVYTCTYCERSFCVSHRLPENHACTNVPRPSGGTWFPEKFDAGSVRLSVGSNRDRLVSNHPTVSGGFPDDIKLNAAVDPKESSGSWRVVWWLAVFVAVLVLVSLFVF